MINNNVCVVAISGASGCGKTSLVQVLGQKYNSPTLHFDDYIDENSYPVDMKLWLDQGCNVSLLQTPRFTQAIIETKRSNSASRFLFIEEPFGRERDVMRPLVDKVILIDTPLPLCLERVIERAKERALSDKLVNTKSPKNEDQLNQYKDKYQSYLGDVYHQCVEQVRSNCELVLSGKKNIASSYEEISHWLNSINFNRLL